MSDTEFFVPKIKCDGCASNIKAAIGPLVQSIDVDIEAKKVRVSLVPDGRSPEQIRQALAEAGYPAS